ATPSPFLNSVIEVITSMPGAPERSARLSSWRAARSVDTGAAPTLAASTQPTSIAAWTIRMIAPLGCRFRVQINLHGVDDGYGACAGAMPVAPKARGRLQGVARRRVGSRRSTASAATERAAALADPGG